MDLGDARRELQHFGLLRTAGDVALRALNRVAVARVLKAVCVDAPDPQYLRVDQRYRTGFLSPGELAQVAQHPEYEMTPGFLREAIGKGDECFGFWDGSVLASYGWYATSPTPVDIPGLTLRFDPRFVYMYKGFTHLQYRGQRLHAIGMTRALAAYRKRGFRGIVSYVDWNNFGSLRSCRRMGYREFGNIYVLRAFGHYLIHVDRGCRAYGFALRLPPEHGGWRASRAA